MVVAAAVVVSLTVLFIIKFTPLELTPYWLHIPFVLAIFAGIPFLIIRAVLRLRQPFKRIGIYALFAMGIFLLVNVVTLLIVIVTLFTSPKTQSIDYRSKLNPDHRIEFQMRPTGLGYQRRYVVVKPVLPFLNWVTRIKRGTVDESKWIKVDEYVNELNLKGG